MRPRIRLRAAAVMAALGIVATPAAANAAYYPGPDGTLHDVHGAIEGKWLGLNKAPGAPLNDETPTARPGAFNNFTRQAVYWSRDAGAHTVGGAFYQYWAARGWENGWLGFPTTDEIGLRGGVMQRYQGATQYWSARTGAHTVTGDLYTLWDSKGWEQGPLGYPASEQAPAAAGGTFQRFSYGAIYQKANPYRYDFIKPYSVSGAFYGYWAGHGFERGTLGYPISEENGLGGGLVTQYFDGGTLYWSPCSGVTTSFPPYCG